MQGKVLRSILLLSTVIVLDISFVNDSVVLQPLWEAMTDLIPEISSVKDNLKNNREQWKALVDSLSKQ